MNVLFSKKKTALLYIFSNSTMNSKFNAVSLAQKFPKFSLKFDHNSSETNMPDLSSRGILYLLFQSF